MGPSTPSRGVSPARSIYSKAKKHAIRVYRTSPRRFTIIAGITLLKVAILLSWAVPKILPWDFLLGNVPSMQLASSKQDPHLLARGLGQVRLFCSPFLIYLPAVVPVRS